MKSTKYNTPAKLAANKRYRARNKVRIARRHAAYVAANPAKIKHHNLRRIGWTLPLYAAALAAQDTRCAICAGDLLTIPSKAIHADHDHVTKKPRGVLCGKCNVGIAMFLDDPERMRSAADYIEHHKRR